MNWDCKKTKGSISAAFLPPRMAVVPRSSNSVTEPHHCSQNYTRMYSFDEGIFSQGFRIINSVKKNSSSHGIKDDKMFLGWKK